MDHPEKDPDTPLGRRPSEFGVTRWHHILIGSHKYETICIHRHFVRLATAAALQQSSERHLILLALDRLWWQLRQQLDQYFDVSQDEMDGFQKALESVSEYQQCGGAPLGGVRGYVTS